MSADEPPGLDDEAVDRIGQRAGTELRRQPPAGAAQRVAAAGRRRRVTRQAAIGASAIAALVATGAVVAAVRSAAHDEPRPSAAASTVPPVSQAPATTQPATTTTEPSTTSTVHPAEPEGTAGALTFTPIDLGPGCTVSTCDVAVSIDGVLVVYDRASNALVWKDGSDRTVPIATALDGAGHIVAVGPGDVAYLAVPSGDVDPIDDLIAVGPDGSVLAREGPFDGSGDTDLAPTTAGLVAVGCCGPETVRPDPDAVPLMTWQPVGDEPVDAGEFPVIESAGPDDLRFSAVRLGTMRWDLPADVPAMRRGMPPAARRTDGGVVIALGADTWDDGELIELLPDGSIQRYPLQGAFPYGLFPDGSALVVTTDGTFAQAAPPSTADVDRLAGWPVAPTDLPTLDDVPLLRPATDPAVAWIERSEGQPLPDTRYLPSYMQYWVDPVRSAQLSITTRLSPDFNQGRGTPLDMPGWDSAERKPTSEETTHLALRDPNGYVTVWAQGLAAETVESIASTLTRRPGAAGWDVDITGTGLVAVDDTWVTQAAGRALWWHDDVGLVAELSVMFGPIGLDNGGGVGEVVGISDVDGNLALTSSYEHASLVAWSPSPGVTVYAGYRGTLDEALAFARSLTLVDRQTWERGTIVRTGDGCDSLFC